MQIPPTPKKTPSEDSRRALDLTTSLRTGSSEGLDIPDLQRFPPSFAICYGGFSGTVTTQCSMSDIHREILILARVSAITRAMLEFQTHSTRLADALRSEEKSETQVVGFLGVIMDLSTVGEGILTPLEVALLRYAEGGNVCVGGEVLEEMRRVVRVAGMKEEAIVEALISARSICLCRVLDGLYFKDEEAHRSFEPPRARL